MARDKRIAIIGAGISGLAAAHHLRGHGALTLFETDTRAGGHAHTLDIEVDGKNIAVDVAFMVYNHRNYPRFTALLQSLGIEGRDTDMSFSVVHDAYGLTYNGGSIGGLIADKRNLLRPRFWQLLREILRFNRLARRTLRDSAGANDSNETLHAFLARHRFTPILSDAYLLPMGASIWSCTPDEFANAPAQFVLSFFDNHGLINLIDRPQWMHIDGGSRRYVDALLAALPSLTRRPAATAIANDGSVNGEQFDAVIIAAHAPDALSLLTDPTAAQQDILGAFRYTNTDAALHTDTRLLPAQPGAVAAWNYRVAGAGAERHTYPTYHLTRLQHLPGDTPLLLTLNAARAKPDPARILHTFTFSHPLPDAAAISAQRRFDELNTIKDSALHFCGAYWGSGFHEDGAASGIAAAEHAAAALQP